MLGIRCTFAEKNDRWEDEVDEDMYDDRDPDHDSEGPGEIQHEDVGANTQLNQGHSVQVEQLAYPQEVEVFLQVLGSHDGIPHVLATAYFGHSIAACGAGYSDDLLTD